MSVARRIYCLLWGIASRLCLISSPTEGWASAQILDENLGVAAVAQLGDALLSDLSHALTCKTELVAYFLKALFLTSYTEAFADDGYLSL